MDDDFILDDTIIHIDTSDSCIFTQDMYNRLLACYELLTTFREYGGIYRIGMYFAMYGLLNTMPVPGRKAADEITGWFDEAWVL